MSASTYPPHASSSALTVISNLNDGSPSVTAASRGRPSSVVCCTANCAASPAVSVSNCPYETPSRRSVKNAPRLDGRTIACTLCGFGVVCDACTASPSTRSVTMMSPATFAVNWAWNTPPPMDVTVDLSTAPGGPSKDRVNASASVNVSRRVPSRSRA